MEKRNGNQKKAEVAMLISDKIDFKIKTTTRNKEGHSSDQSIQQEDITIIKKMTGKRMNIIFNELGLCCLFIYYSRIISKTL